MGNELPPLPQPPHYSANPLDAWEPSEDLWDAAQMQAYAAAAVLAERERCAKLCETLNHGAFGSESYLRGIQDGSTGCAAAIRKGERP